MLSDNQLQCNILADYFSSVFVEDKDVLPVFPLWCKKHLDLFDANARSVLRSIRKLYSNTFVKSTAKAILWPSSTIFLHSLFCSHLLPAWKCSFVSNLAKKPLATLIQSYRPNSLASSVCKVFKVIAKEIARGFQGRWRNPRFHQENGW